MYVTPDNKGPAPKFTLLDDKRIKGPANFSGTIQLAKLKDLGEQEYDKSAGTYATSAQISGSVEGQRGKYTLKWRQGGDTSRPLIMFTLPHHVNSMDAASKRFLTKIELTTVSKGIVRAIMASNMTMEEELPTGIDFGPWAPDGKVHDISVVAREKIMSVAREELQQDHGWAVGAPANCAYMMGKVRRYRSQTRLTYSADHSIDLDCLYKQVYDPQQQ
jgi:endo-1,3(4)-beta-glucanase